MGIESALAALRRRAGAPAPAADKFDPADHTVDDVKAYVDAHPDERQAVLAAEQAGKARVTLIDWLEGPAAV